MEEHMKCDECGQEMGPGQPEEYSYTGCGLPDVKLVGVTVRRCTSCDNEEVDIPRILELHKLIACEVSEKPGRLGPQEIQFLRRQLGWSAEDFAANFKKSLDAILAWENGTQEMPEETEGFFRVLAVLVEPAHDYLIPAQAPRKHDHLLQMYRMMGQPARTTSLSLASEPGPWHIIASAGGGIHVQAAERIH
jgi:putative zinc finger/helix-turn-helix YgiT family protein